MLVCFTPYYLYNKIPSDADILIFLRLLLNLYLIYHSGIFKKSRNLKTELILLYVLTSLYVMVFVGSITFEKIY